MYIFFHVPLNHNCVSWTRQTVIDEETEAQELCQDGIQAVLLSL